VIFAECIFIRIMAIFEEDAEVIGGEKGLDV